MLNFARVLTFLLGQIPKSQKSPSATRTSLGSIYSPFPSHNFPLSFVISPQNFETWTTTSSAHHTLCFYFITLLSVYACHHVHTIHAMFIASSIHVVAHLCYLFIWHFVVPWLHKATVMFLKDTTTLKTSKHSFLSDLNMNQVRATNRLHSHKVCLHLTSSLLTYSTNAT